MTRIFIFIFFSWVFIISFGCAVSYRPSFPNVLPTPVSTTPVSSAVSTDNSDVDVDVMLLTMPAVIATM